jgi:hypothetical protein
MDKFIRYICLFYDHGSPLVRKIGDHIERKKAAATIAGFKVSEDLQFSSEVVDMLYCRTEKTNECIIDYLRGLNAPDWAYICATGEAYYSILEELASNVEEDSETTKTSVDIAQVRARLASQASTMGDDLKKKTWEFLSRDESPYLHKNLFSLIEEQKLRPKLTPEAQVNIEA